MQTIIYDTTFEGFLTAVFEVYEYKIKEPDIQREGFANATLFADAHVVHTDENKAQRVIKKMKEKISPIALRQLYKTFLSGLPSIQNVMLRYIQYALRSTNGMERDFSNPDVLMVHQTAHKVEREKHRMEAFVRFQKTKDELYYAIIQPDFEVLPLISKHFEERYADQRWLIYDVRRKYGLYYDLSTVNTVTINFSEELNNKEPATSIYDEHEDLYQSLWQTYFNSVNIKARKNMKLHIQHMPKRYWKYLTEKKPGKT